MQNGLARFWAVGEKGGATDKAYFEYATMTRSDEGIENIDTAFKVKYLYRQST